MTTSGRKLTVFGILISPFLLGFVIAAYNDLETITMNSLLVNDQVGLPLKINSHLTLFPKFKVLRKIGGGTYGSVYDGINIKTSERVAIKMELLETTHPMLWLEYERYQRLNNSRKLLFLDEYE
jgi:serine/threonine protein kinase